MGFFRDLFTSAGFQFVLLGLAVVTGGLSIVAGSTLALIAKIGGIALGLAGLTVGSAYAFRPDSPRIPNLKTSVTLTNAYAAYVAGTSRVPGIITAFQETREAVILSNYKNFQRSIDCLYTVANHPLLGMDAFYFANHKFNAVETDKRTGLVRFSLERRDDQSDEEYSRLNRDFQANLKVIVHFTGDNTQSVQDIVGTRIVGYRTRDSITIQRQVPAIFPPGSTIYYGEGTSIRLQGGADFHASWILFQFNSNKKFWTTVGGYNPRNASFVVRNSDNAADLIPQFYEDFLNIPKSTWNADNLTEIRNLVNTSERPLRKINGYYNSNNKEQALSQMLTRAFDGRTVYEDGEYYLRANDRTEITKTITKEDLIDYVSHQIGQDIFDYANTIHASIYDKNNEYNVRSIGKVRHTEAIEQDGKEIQNDVGTLGFINDKRQAEMYIRKQLSRQVTYSEISCQISMEDPPNFYDRVRFELPEEGINGDTYRVEQVITPFNGSTILTLVRDVDELYDAHAGELVSPSRDYTSTYVPQPPTAIGVAEEIDVSSAKNVIDATLTLTNDVRSTSAYLEVFYNEIEHNTLTIEGNRYIIQDIVANTEVKVRAYGQIGDRRSTAYKELEFTAGSLLPAPSLLSVPVLRWSQLINLLTVTVETGADTTAVEIRYSENVEPVTSDIIDTNSTLLAIHNTAPGVRTTWSGDLPADVSGLTRIVCIPLNPWNIRGPISQQVININRTSVNEVYEEHNLNWPGTVSRSLTDYGEMTDDLYRTDNCLIIGSRLRAETVSGSHWLSNNAEVVPFFRKTDRVMSYTSDNKVVPTTNIWTNHVIRVYCDVLNLLNPAQRLSSGYSVQLSHRNTEGGAFTDETAVIVTDDDLIEFTVSGGIVHYKVKLEFQDTDTESLFVCAMQINATHSL